MLVLGGGIAIRVVSHLSNNEKKLYCVLLDFRKAFDYIDRDILWHKIIALVIRCRIIDGIQSVYNIIKSRVQVRAKKKINFIVYWECGKENVVGFFIYYVFE